MEIASLNIALAQFPTQYDLHVIDGEVYYGRALRGNQDILDRLTMHRLLRDPTWRRQFEFADAAGRQQMSRSLTGRA